MSAILLVGSGGREHALAWKLAQSPEITRLILAPGNDAMAWGLPRGLKIERWPTELSKGRPEFRRLAEEAKRAGVELAVVGPDDPLAAGIVDELESVGILTFGPRAEAARIEASKGFAKDVMRAAKVPTAAFETFESVDAALGFVRSRPWGGPCVIKADGLALGKGVVVCASVEEAEAAIASLIRINGKLVVEERLSGEELSWLAFCDGERCALLEPARDYKRIADGDRGPNTGGMGSFSPVPGIPESWAERVRETVFLPTLRELKRRGAPFRGVLYAGLMADAKKDALWVIEFNSRFGDPETQVLMPRLDGDVVPWFRACAQGDLSRLPSRVPFRREAAVYVVAAAAGYPESPRKGDAIAGVDLQGEWNGVFVAGARSDGARGLATAGGRVLGALGTGGSLAEARAKAYARLSSIRFEGIHYRKDIAG